MSPLTALRWVSEAVTAVLLLRAAVLLLLGYCSDAALAVIKLLLLLLFGCFSCFYLAPVTADV